jgi:hypothetical protein
MHRYVSPVFLALLVASFILWYIAKLSYTYTAEQTVKVSVDGQPFEVTCVVEGVGTNLFGYRVYMNKTLRIPLAELKTKRSYEEGHEGNLERLSVDTHPHGLLGGVRIAQFRDIPKDERRDEQRQKNRRHVAVHPFQPIFHHGNL